MSEPPDRVDRSLRTLAGAPASAHWRDPKALRRRARRRHRNRWTGGVAGAVVVAVGIALAVVVPGPGSPGPVPPLHVVAGQHVANRSGIAAQLVSDAALPASPDSTAGTATAAVAKAEQAFALDLLGQLDSSGSSGNVVISPSSLATALAMLQTGASGRTAKQIAATLHTPGLSSRQQDAGWAALSADLAAAGKASGVTVQSADSLWLQQNLPMAPDFMTAMARYFRAGVWQVDFAHRLAQATQALNDWVAKQTHGKITKLFAPGALTQRTVLLLADAVYFKAAWKYEFAANATQPGPFTDAAGHTSSVPFMSYGRGEQPPVLPVVTTPSYRAVQLPYTGGRFAALAIMPTSQPLGRFVRGMSVDRLHAIVAALHPSAVDLRLPKFTLTRYTDLNATLSALGMPTAFGPSADFSAMSPRPLQVHTIAQRAYLKVDEKGTEAAAVTGIGMTPTVAVQSLQLRFDHPFLFLVRDTRTGAILFAAQVEQPSG